VPGVDQLARPADLGQHLGDEVLAAEARLDGHDQQGVELREDLEVGLQRGGRLDRQAGQRAGGPQVAGHRAGIPTAGLRVHGDVAGAGRRVAGGPALGRLDHQMAVERDGADPLDRLDDRQAEGQVGHEVRVHHIDVQPVGVGDPLGLVGEPGEIGGEQARRDQRLPVHGRRV